MSVLFCNFHSMRLYIVSTLFRYFSTVKIIHHDVIFKIRKKIGVCDLSMKETD